MDANPVASSMPDGRRAAGGGSVEFGPLERRCEPRRTALVRRRARRLCPRLDDGEGALCVGQRPGTSMTPCNPRRFG
ncbi:hypothetical protein CLG85_009275 [Yangia mangrovi]|uniref:Uncharacterized protein n=1 Tax=Alloyangia mangrovi TaxID=1779329 RepID=A0A2A3JNZ1_9RHOB|nr:hypothetical protein [Alloyangia mangrovi]MCT4370500.1 hypothetical protein [Alloyangia mangrovi]